MKTVPGPPCAINVICEGVSNVAVHCEGQSIPGGLLVTRPGPTTVTRRFAESGAALAPKGRVVQAKSRAPAIARRGRRCSAAEM